MQDENAKAAAIRTIEDSADKIKRKKTEVEEHEISLDKEEKVLEGIRDSLKGKIDFLKIIRPLMPTHSKTKPRYSTIRSK